MPRPSPHWDLVITLTCANPEPSNCHLTPLLLPPSSTYNSVPVRVKSNCVCPKRIEQGNSGLKSERSLFLSYIKGLQRLAVQGLEEALYDVTRMLN